MFGNHGLCGLPEEGAHEKSPKCLGGNLGDFGGILQRSQTAYKDSHAADCLVDGVSRTAICGNGIVMADFSATASLINGKVATVGRYLNPIFSV